MWARKKSSRFFAEASDLDLFTNGSLLRLVNYLHDRVYSSVCGPGSISMVWSNELNQLRLGLEEDLESPANPSMRYLIRIRRKSVLTKDLIYLVVAHELAHCVVSATSTCSHFYHGRAFLNAVQRLYHYNPASDFYDPARQI